MNRIGEEKPHTPRPLVGQRWSIYFMRHLIFTKYVIHLKAGCKLEYHLYQLSAPQKVQVAFLEENSATNAASCAMKCSGWFPMSCIGWSQRLWVCNLEYDMLKKKLSLYSVCLNFCILVAWRRASWWMVKRNILTVRWCWINNWTQTSEWMAECEQRRGKKKK